MSNMSNQYPPAGGGVGGGVGSGPTGNDGNRWNGFDSLRGLHRSRDNRVIAGVCGGLAQRLNIDPVILRVLVVALTFFGGIGVVLYAVAWLVIPEEGVGNRSMLEGAFGSRDVPPGSGGRPVAKALALIAVIGIFVICGATIGPRSGFVVLLIAIAMIFFIAHERGRPHDGAPPSPPNPAGDPWGGGSNPTAPYDPTMPVPRPAVPIGPWSAPPGTPYLDPAAETVSFDTSTMPTTSTAQWAPPTPFDPYGTDYPPVPDLRVPPGPTGSSGRVKPRSYLGVLTFSVMVLALGLLGVIDASGVNVSPVAYAFTALAIVGLGLLVGTVYGRSRSLIALGIVGSLAFLPLAAVDGVTDGHWVNWSTGHEVVEEPAQLDQIQPTYSADMGRFVLDLRNLDFTGSTVRTSIDLGAGQIWVILPPDVDATVTGSVHVGELKLLDHNVSGVNATDKVTDLGADGAGAGKLVLNVSADIGQVEVTREAA